MKRSVSPPVYSQIAYDIASKIASGSLKEGARFSGRSLMSAKYGVSQETIRRAMNQLSDMEIIEVNPNSGAVVISRDRANKYTEKFQTVRDIRTLKRELRELLEERAILDDKILEIIDQITDLKDRFKSSDPLKSYEFEISANSSIIGKSIQNVQFRQRTEATIVAIKSEDKILLSPGPNAVFKPLDIIVVYGSPYSIEKVRKLIK